MDDNGSASKTLATEAMTPGSAETPRATQEILGAAIAALDEGILVRDSRGSVLLCNASAERILGPAARDLLGGARQESPSYFITEDGSALPIGSHPRQLVTGAVQQDSKVVLGIIDPQRPLTWVSVNSRSLSGDGEVGPCATVMSFTDITENKQSADALKQSLDKLRRALDGAIRTMATAAEMLDPSATGHQRRVAALAAAIATKLGLSEHEVESVRVAAEIHDIGKITIPAEVLSTPRRLSELEFRIVKRHPQAAYDILKDAELASPIAGMVLQHHERMDGSGYPSGLTGDDIILGARILAVADVVETMSSPRAYRRALGIDEALGEITQQRGVLYAPDVVDACVKVIAEQGFSFE